MKRGATVDLNRQLEAYAAVAKLPEHDARRRWAKWPIYAAATGAALAGASAASAEIIYSGVQNLTARTNSGFASLSIDVDGKNDRFKFDASNFVDPLLFNNFPGFFRGDAGARFFNPPGTRSGGIFTIGGKGSARNFPLGALISGTHGLTTAGLLFSNFLNGKGCGIRASSFPTCVSTSTGNHGRFKGGGILGIEFNGKSGPRENGWIRVGFSGDAGPVGPQGPVFIPRAITVVDWAYNTNGPILAGQTSSPVPEPRTLPILLLATGAAGVLAWKRRRSQQAANS